MPAIKQEQVLKLNTFVSLKFSYLIPLSLYIPDLILIPTTKNVTSKREGKFISISHTQITAMICALSLMRLCHPAEAAKGLSRTSI